MTEDTRPEAPAIPGVTREPLVMPQDEFEAVKVVVERVRALAQSWASLPGEDAATDVDRRVGTVLLGMLDSSIAADVALSRVTEVAEGWERPGGPGLFYPAAGQVVLDAIRGGSTEVEAAWRARAEAAEAKLAALAAYAREHKGPADFSWMRAGDILAIIGSEGEAVRGGAYDVWGADFGVEGGKA